MITRIREVRRAKKMTLQDVADRCVPATTPQTIGRLETGARTVSLAWLNRIADALGVEATDLVLFAERDDDVPLAAEMGDDGVHAPRRAGVVLPPRPEPGMVAVAVQSSVGDYRSGDEIWCLRLEPEDFGRALNRDVLVPRPGGGSKAPRAMIVGIPNVGKSTIANTLMGRKVADVGDEPAVTKAREPGTAKMSR